MDEVESSHATTTARARWRSCGTPLVIAAVVACLVAAGPSYLALPRVRAWDAATVAAVGGYQDGVWHWMRGGLAYLAGPFLGVVTVLSAVLVARRDRRQAGVVAAVAAAGYLAVEAVKAGVLPLPGAAGGAFAVTRLSGHGASAAAALVAVVAAASTRRRVVAAGGVVALVGVGTAVVLARWHLFADGVLAMLMVAVVASAASAAVRAVRGCVRARNLPARNLPARNLPTTTVNVAPRPVLAPLVMAALGVVVVTVLAAGAGTGVVTPRGIVGVLAAGAGMLAGAALVVVAASLDLAAAWEEQASPGEGRRTTRHVRGAATRPR
ncbi:hypothetical protein [Xylanimonas allomyrinae]|uniref:hypothetical protein n=1 Tax=Xylanimonas allomyrinae TaxID=2509459 RepID=UPI0013A65796|nr:hypothetical protein [Xylanimonas allomyrinae]